MNFLQLILLPFSILYGIIILFRNKLFDWKIIPSKSFNIPVISVGNLSVGGTGKSPHVEYLTRMLKDDFIVAVLSRGYKRKSKGFVLADETKSVSDIGDEPVQFFTKFKDVKIAVDEKRVNGIQILQKQFPDLEAIILDDAFQHRYVKPGLSILLTDFHKLYTNDYPLPAGKLREFRSGAKRADIIIVTKTSKVLSPITRRRITELINPQHFQKLYFSYIKHGKLKQIPGIDFTPVKNNKHNTILLIAGIANTYPLELYLKKHCEELEILKFPDHHRFTQKDAGKIVETFDNIITKKKIVVTTEKDVMRLSQPEIIEIIKYLPIYYVPIEIVFHSEDKKEFNKQIIDYVRKNTKNNSVHKE